MSQPLLNLAPSSLVKLRETVSGVTRDIPFLVAAHGHHAPGRTTLLRQLLWPVARMTYQYSYVGNNYYSGCLLDDWLGTTYRACLDPEVRDLLANVSIRVGSGTATISRELFLLSVTELGTSCSWAYTEGTAIAYFNSGVRRIGYLETGEIANYWTRSPATDSANQASTISGNNGEPNRSAVRTDIYRVRPALTLPSGLRVSDAADGQGAYLLSFAAAVPVRVSGVWREAEPKARVSGAWREAEPKIKVSGAWYDAG